MSPRRLAVLSILLFAFQSAVGQAKRVTLELGPVSVWLGMPKQQVLEKFTAAGYEIEDPEEKVVYVRNKSPFQHDDSWLNIFRMSFTAGKLSYAERSWLDESDPLGSVTKAIGELTGHGSRDCSVSYNSANNPGYSDATVFIECANKTVYVTRGEYASAPKGPHFEVSEYIGTLPRK
jgi:hypothetical protein